MSPVRPPVAAQGAASGAVPPLRLALLGKTTPATPYKVDAEIYERRYMEQQELSLKGRLYISQNYLVLVTEDGLSVDVTDTILRHAAQGYRMEIKLTPLKEQEEPPR